MLKAYKYRIYPNDLQIKQLSNIFGSVRFVYNLGLETKIQAYISNKVNLTCFDLNKQVTDLKKELLWLNDSPAQALQMSINNLDNAYTKFFKGSGFPKFKNKYSKQSFKLPQMTKIDFTNGKVFIPKLRWIDCVFDRQFNGLIKTMTISKTVTNKYFVSILVDNKKDIPSKSKVLDNDKCVGIDLGIKDLAILSDGTKFENHNYFNKLQNKLRIEQRKLSRCIKDSKNRDKQKLKVALIHEKIKNQRIDYLHKITTSIVKKYDTIILEDLNVKSLIENNSKSMSKAISNVSWAEIKRQFEYKSMWYGKNLLFIGRFEPSSKTCSNCGTIKSDLKLNHREWTCSKCKITHDRDINAAINIKTFGIRNKV